VVGRPGDDSEGSSGESSSAGRLSSELGQGGAGEKQWEEGMPGRPFIGLEGERGGWVTEGNRRRRWSAMMMVEAVISGGDRSGRWWGVKRGSAPAISGAEWGSWEAALGGNARACEEAVVASAVQSGEEDDRVGWASWADQRPRPSGGWRQWPNQREKGSGLAKVEGEAGRG
jgi:hypothetical protein